MIALESNPFDILLGKTNEEVAQKVEVNTNHKVLGAHQDLVVKRNI